MRKSNSPADEVREPPRGSRFLTVTINPRLNAKPPSYQFAVTYNDLVHILNIYARDFCLVTELTLQACVHYHIWFVLRNNNAQCFMCAKLKAVKNLGFIKVNADPIVDTVRTLAYMLDSKCLKEGANLNAAIITINRWEVVTNYTPLIN